MVWYSLSITGSTPGSTILAEIDSKILIRGSGSPVGAVAAAVTGQAYYDYTNGIFYECSVTDGTVIGTTWVVRASLSRYVPYSKTSSFTASDGANSYYRMSTNDMTVTLLASPADGSVLKFKMITASKTATFALNGAEVVNHPTGESNQTLTLEGGQGVIELIAVTGGWDIT